MPNPKDFKMKFRPKAYFKHAEHIRTVNIDGKIKRVIPFDPDHVEDYLDSLDDEDCLDEEEDEDPNTVAIAVIELESIMSDFVCVQATLGPDGLIHYSVADEYTSISHPETSSKPLSFRELIDLLDNIKTPLGTGVTCYRNNEYGLNGPGKFALDQAVDFVCISSSLYPELQSWYYTDSQEWYAKRLAELNTKELNTDK